MPKLEDLIAQAKSEKGGGEEVRKIIGEDKKREENVLIASYGDVKIYKVAGQDLLHYEIPVPRYLGEEKVLITSLIDIATKVIETETETYKTAQQRRFAYRNKILDIINSTPELKVPPNSKEFYADVVLKEMVGYGLIDDLIKDDNLEEIMIIGPGKPVYVFHRKYDMMTTNVVYYDDKDIKDLIDKIARNIGRRIDIQNPLLDARLPDGTRVNATIPPVSVDGSTLTLRKFREDPLTIIDLLNLKTMNLEIAAFLWLATDGFGAKPANILISGGTASGKTSTLNILSSFIPTNERVLTVEDTAELNLPLSHWIRFETRPPGMEGVGEITMNDLVKNSLRMRPDRIIVGEIRGEEGFTLFSAMNTGHDGCMGTVHANSAKETLTRLFSPPISVPVIMLDSLNFIVMQQRINDRRKGLIRRITEIAEVVPSEKEGELPELRVLYTWDPAVDEIQSTKLNSFYIQTLMRYTGLSKSAINQEISNRAEILRKMQVAGIRKLKDVCFITQNYILRTKRGD
jgi:flagellar protein FlaI